ncbi:MAG TPA: T9SS type A sorting domain-containing protein [Ignavibacteriaceae bacterium]|nr:T9SS type A sorting domain-containing protein [Ignavibacteriaceae bacterium]
MKHLKPLISIAFLFLYLYSYSHPNFNKKGDDNSSAAPEEIIFYSHGAEFAPVIILQDSAEILWTWDDNTTSNSATPVKYYGNEIMKINKLKVTPWSAVKRINVGYDGEDGGSDKIEFVKDQYISKVENIELVAPYLKQWCSSYSRITSLNFDNFVNLDTIECYLCQSLQNVSLNNTPKLSRTCFELNKLQNLDYSGCSVLAEIRVSTNMLTNIVMPANKENIWHLCIHSNTQLTDQLQFNDMSEYPNIADFFVWNSNRSGDLVIPKTNPSRWIGIRGYENQYTSMDLRGALQSPIEAGFVDMHKNKLTKVDITGCHQIKSLDLSDNLLSSEMVEQVLKQLDEFGPTITPRKADLSKNSPITAQGKIYKANLEAKGWEVIVDYPTDANELNQIESFSIYPNPSRGKFHVQLNKVPTDGVMIEITNVLGQKLMEQKIYNNDSEWSVDQYQGKMFFVTIRGTNLLQTKRIIVN